MSSDTPDDMQDAPTSEPRTNVRTLRSNQTIKGAERHLRLVYSNPIALPKDDDLIAAVQRILQASSFDMHDIMVTAKGADVTLSGSIRGKQEVSRASVVARSVRGVRVVHNELFGW
jgi:hypothetical protein